MIQDPLWYKDAVFYELHVKAFADSNGDGIGDFLGLLSKLDYLAELGVTCIWLLPMYPSPFRDDGYDIADYLSIHHAYGTLDDFRKVLKAAHDRGLRVITELVLNHTSNQHPWFQDARRSKDSPYRQYYVFSDDPDTYRDARIIFTDTETSNWSWDPEAGQYYWHRFFAEQPDLNYDYPPVREEIWNIMKFWLDLGLDGFRVDAVPYLFEREGTNCENLPETHDVLKMLRQRIDHQYPGLAKILLAEANMWPADVRAYFGDGDEFQMCFHFPIMPRLFMSLRLEDRKPLCEIFDQTPEIPDNCQWGLFLRNHDELTLEMVTHIERDYMLDEYARDPQARINLGIRRRLAPLLNNNRQRIELMYAILLSLKGSPFIYYGDEIGMGDNLDLGDRDGVRTPMQWNADKNAGFTSPACDKLYLPVIKDPLYVPELVNVEDQKQSETSLLNWMKTMIRVRKTSRAFGRGQQRFLASANHRTLAIVREFEDEKILVVANLSATAQIASLDLAEWAGFIPIEMLGGAIFPRISDKPYLFTLSPQCFFWLKLRWLGGTPWKARI